MRHYIFNIVLFVCLSTVSLCAQNNDSIRQLIHQQEGSTLLTLANGRLLIIDQLNKGDIMGMAETKQFLIQEFGNPYNVFTLPEYILLCFWTEDYAAIFREVQHQNFRNIPHPSPVRTFADMDKLEEKIALRSAESYFPLTVYVNDSEIDADEKAFLNLLLFSMLFSSPNIEDRGLAEANWRATNFIDEFPESRFVGFVRDHIRYEFEVSKWGMGYEFFAGYGNHSGQLGNQLTGGFSLGMGLDFSYLDILFSLRMNSFFPRTQSDMTINYMHFPKNTSLLNGFYDIAVHYPVINRKQMQLFPFAGVGLTSFSASESARKDNEELKRFRSGTSPTYSAGLNFRFNFWNNNVDLTRGGGGSISVRYTFYIPTNGTNYYFERGNTHLITIGWSDFSRRTRRVR